MYERYLRWSIFLLLGSLAVFVVLAFAAYVGDETGVLGKFRESLGKNPPLSLGLPAAALTSFAIVAFYWGAYPPDDKDDDRGLTLKVLGLEFSGPGGPVSLWIACFMSLVIAIDLLS